MTEMDFEYFYKEQSENYTFYRIPKLLFTNESFMDLSLEAKLLYGLLLDRVSLSRDNGWIDGQGKVYVFFRVESVKEALRCGNSKACRLLEELEDFGLIEREKRGQGKPAMIYVKNFSSITNREFLTSQNENSRLPERGIQDFHKWECNKNNKNQTNTNNTNLLLSADSGSERDRYKAYFMDRWEYDHLREEHPWHEELLASILDIAVDTACSKQKYVRIEGDQKPIEVVRSALMKLDSSHVSYVVDCLLKNDQKVRSVKKYLLAALYNAPLTRQMYFQSWVNHDTARGLFTNGGKISEEG